MKIRRKSEKLGSPDGVAPVHTLITCTYQKLFKRDGCFDNGGVGTGHGGGGGSGSAPEPGSVQLHNRQKRQKLGHRHELGRSSSWANGRRLREEAKEVEAPGSHNLGDEEKHGDGDGHDLHVEARGNPLLPKRRKVKSTRYADFAQELTPPSHKAEKRSRNIEKHDQDTADYISTVASSKEALIASIFYVFDTLGKSGLTASEVVAVMLEQSLPGLKEGGARHTVQVANVLRRSRYFISIGNKQYLPCSVAEPDLVKKQGGRSHGQGSKSKQGRTAQESCKLYDGSGWHCSQEAHPAFSLCAHHLDMINRPLGKLQAAALTSTSNKASSSSPVKDNSPMSQHEEEDEEKDRESESSDHDESEDIGPALAKWGRDRTPGSAPSQKRKMLSLMSIK